MSKMNPEIKARWVAALRSGEYQQGRSKLKEGEYMCCLGVLCDLHAKEHRFSWEDVGSVGYYEGERNYLPDSVQKWSGLPARTGVMVRVREMEDYLANHNDAGCSFAQIADAIEEQL